MVIGARIIAKGQTTIPQEIRAALQIGPGDLIAWELAGDGSARVQLLGLECLRALEGTLPEWGKTADEEAYRDL